MRLLKVEISQIAYPIMIGVVKEKMFLGKKEINNISLFTGLCV
jgi:hypothetical protein